jgi:integrase
MSSAVVAGRIPSNPCDHVPLPKIELDEMRFLAPDEIARLAAEIDVRYRALVLVAAFGGLRIGELAGLRRKRVDAKRSGVHVAEIVVEVRGELIYGPPKTRAGRRFVTLPRSVMQALVTHLETFTGPGSEDFVFPSPWGGALRVPAWRRRFWVPGVEMAELAPLTPHELRHTAIALWIASGANPLEVSRRAGHSSTSFTLDRYGHLFPEADQSVADRLELLISDGRKTDEVPHPAEAKPDLTLLPGTMEWALEDSNLRPQPCEGCALTN